jgi:hypothetical protein
MSIMVATTYTTRAELYAVRLKKIMLLSERNTVVDVNSSDIMFITFNTVSSMHFVDEVY